jgi:uncharacterized protein
MHPYAQSLLGGLMIGAAAWLTLASLGRVAGVSSVAAGALVPSATERATGGVAWRWAFLGGLALGGVLMSGWWQTPTLVQRPAGLLIAAGLLVGFGTVLDSGCTSGHGVCGLGRRSTRSLVATVIFMAVGMVTVFLVQRFMA